LEKRFLSYGRCASSKQQLMQIQAIPKLKPTSANHGHAFPLKGAAAGVAVNVGMVANGRSS
jgi:hypothetical protein